MIEDFEIDIQSTTAEINRLLSNGFVDRGPDWVQLWYDLSLEWSDTDPQYVMYPSTAIPRLLEISAESRDVFELALFIAGTRIACEKKLHADLRNFISKFLLGQIQKPKVPAGRPTKPTWGRDYIIIRVMSDLELSLGLPMSQNVERGKKKTHETTCGEIVEIAIARSKMPNLTRQQIEKIWAREKARAEYAETQKLRDYHALDDMNFIERE